MSIKPQGFGDMVKAMLTAPSDPRFGLPPRPATRDEVRNIVREELKRLPQRPPLYAITKAGDWANYYEAIADKSIEALHQIVRMRAGQFSLDEIESYALGVLSDIEKSGYSE